MSCTTIWFLGGKQHLVSKWDSKQGEILWIEQVDIKKKCNYIVPLKYKNVPKYFTVAYLLHMQLLTRCAGHKWCIRFEQHSDLAWHPIWILVPIFQNVRQIIWCSRLASFPSKERDWRRLLNKENNILNLCRVLAIF